MSPKGHCHFPGARRRPRRVPVGDPEGSPHEDPLRGPHRAPLPCRHGFAAVTTPQGSIVVRSARSRRRCASPSTMPQGSWAGAISGQHRTRIAPRSDAEASSFRTPGLRGSRSQRGAPLLTTGRFRAQLPNRGHAYSTVNG